MYLQLILLASVGKAQSTIFKSDSYSGLAVRFNRQLG